MNKRELKCLDDPKLTIEDMEFLGNCSKCERKTECRNRLIRTIKLSL